MTRAALAGSFASTRAVASAAVVAIAVVAIAPGRAGAEPANTAIEQTTPDRDLQAAKAEFEAAQVLFIKGEYEDAAVRFLAAYAKKPFAAFLFNAAVSHEKAGKLDAAVESFQRYLEEDPKASDATVVKARIDAIRGVMAAGAAGAPASGGAATGAGPAAGGSPAGALDAQPGAGPPGGAPSTDGASAPAAAARVAAALPALETKGLVVIDSKPRGATIYLDTKKNGAFAQTPWQGSLPSRGVKLILEAKGFKPEERVINPRSDKLVDVYIALSEEHFLGWVEIVSNVPGADVFIDKKEIGAIGRTPFTGHLKPGKHVVFVERMGYRPMRQEIDVLPGTATQHMIKLEKGDNGWINVTGRGTYGAKVTIDDKITCDAPCRTEVAPGPHHVEVSKRGFEDYEADVTVERTAEMIVDVQWSPRPPRRAAWTTAILSAAFFGGGIYVGRLSDKNADAYQADIAAGMPVDSNDPRLSRGFWQALGANVLYGIGAILAISSTISFLSHGPESTAVLDQRAIGLAPSVSGDGAGLAAWGRF